MKPGTKRSLVARLRAGDRDALKEAYQHYKDGVLALVASMLGGEDAAWDVLHDVFVSFARNAPHLAPETNLDRYLLAAGANRARDYLSKRKASSIEPESPGDIPATGAADPARAVIEKEEAQRLWRAVTSLPEEQRVVVALHIYGKMTFKEIAAADGISESTVQSRYRYGLEKIRRTYGRKLDER